MYNIAKIGLPSWNHHKQKSTQPIKLTNWQRAWKIETITRQPLNQHTVTNKFRLNNIDIYYMRSEQSQLSDGNGCLRD